MAGSPLAKEGEKTAVFYDAENVTSIRDKEVAANFKQWLGTDYDITALFAFADWSGPYREVGDMLYQIGFDLIHVPDTLKDSADCQMGAYIMDWNLRSPETMTYVFVTGDSIFQPLMKGLQKQGKHVVIVSDLMITGAEIILRADRYIDIATFRKRIDIGSSPDEEKKRGRSKKNLREIALQRLQETITKLKAEHRQTYRNYVIPMLQRLNPDVPFGNPGFNDWNETIDHAIYEGIVRIAGEGKAAQLRLSEDVAKRSVEKVDSLDSALIRFSDIVKEMHEQGEHTGMESVVHKVREMNIDYEDLGYDKFGDFARMAESRGFVKIAEQEGRPPILKPVYSESFIEEWYRKNLNKYFGKGAKTPQPKFLMRTVQFLDRYDTSLSKLDDLMSNRHLQKTYQDILETSGVSFIPPYEKVLLFILFGRSYSCKDALEIVNKEMAPLGYDLKCPC